MDAASVYAPGPLPFIKAVGEEHFAEAECIRVVLDNLNTHQPAAFYEYLDLGEARRLALEAGVSFHACTQQLAEHGRDRDQRVLRATSGPADP